MGKLIVMASRDTRHAARSNRASSKRNHVGMTIADFRRFLTNLRLQPPSHREFLRKLLRRALAAHGAKGFPVTLLADTNPLIRS
jgi:hypothetical protein